MNARANRIRRHRIALRARRRHAVARAPDAPVWKWFHEQRVEVAQRWMGEMNGLTFALYADSQPPEMEPVYRRALGPELRAVLPKWAAWVEANIFSPLDEARAQCEADPIPQPPEDGGKVIQRRGQAPEHISTAAGDAYSAEIAARTARVRARFLPIFDRLRVFIDLLPERDEPWP